MFKHNDTDVLDQINLSSGAYALAHSEKCEAKHGTGYTVRHYSGQKDVHPWADEGSDSIDFVDLADALAQLGTFPVEDKDSLTEWLNENLA